MVFTTRYLDLFTHYYGMYNTMMKIFFLSSTAWAIYLTHRSDSGAYDPEQDSFQHMRYLVVPVTILAVVTHHHFWHGFWFQELLWSFSIYMESVAMLPQLVMVWRHRRVERLAGFYIFGMGLYRMFYVLNWIYRAHTELHYKHNWRVYTCGVIQSVLYTDFFYYAITKRERPLVTWRRVFTNVTSAAEPLLQDESCRDDEDESQADVLLTERSAGDGVSDTPAVQVQFL